MQFLKADTLVKAVIGPAVAVGDGFTPVTTLALTTADEAEIMKHDAAAVTSISANTFAAITSADGYYNLTITAAQLDTEGMLTVLINDDSLILPIRHDFMVVNANVYDSLYAVAATDFLQVDTVQLASTTQDATDLADFAAAGYDPATNKVQGVVLVDTTTANTDLVTAGEIADAVWDELLTGATHNIATSAGRRLRALQDFGLYEGGMVWIDTVNGTAGTTDFENGTVNNPVLTIADALTIRASVGLPGFHIIPGSTVTLAATVDNFEFVGAAWILALGSQSIDNCLIVGATVSGVYSGTPHFEKCSVGNITGGSINAHVCGLTGTITVNGAGDWFIHHCFSEVAGTSSPIFDFGAAILNTNLNMRAYSGGIDLRNCGQAGTDNASIEGNGQVILNVNCVGGTAAVRGAFAITDNSATTTLTFDDLVTDVNSVLSDTNAILDDTGTSGVLLAATATSAQLVDDIWDEVLSGATHNVMSSSGRRLRQVTSVVIRDDTAQGPGTGTNQIQFDTGASAVDGAYDPARVAIIGGTGVGQSRLILQYNGATKTATVDRDWKTNPDATSEFVIIADSGREHVNEGLAQAGAAGTITLNALASSLDDVYVDQTIFIRSGTGADQARLITAYNGTTKVATVDKNWGTNPDTTSAYVMLPTSLAAIASIVDAVWDESTTGHTTAGTFGEQCKTDIDSILDDTGTSGVIVTGTPDVNTVQIDGNAEAAADLSLSARTIVTGAAIAGTLSTTQMTTNLTEATDDHYNGRIIIWTSGVLKDQATDITDYTGATKLLTYTATTEAPSATDTFVIV